MLALEVGESHGWVQALPHDEYVRWRAFFVWRHAEQAHAADVARMRSR